MSGIPLAQGLHGQDREGQEVRHAGQADHRGRVAKEIEENVHVEGLVGVDRLVVAEIDGQPASSKARVKYSGPSGTCSSRSTSSPKRMKSMLRLIRVMSADTCGNSVFFYSLD